MKIGRPKLFPYLKEGRYKLTLYLFRRVAVRWLIDTSWIASQAPKQSCAHTQKGIPGEARLARLSDTGILWGNVAHVSLETQASLILMVMGML